MTLILNDTFILHVIIITSSQGNNNNTNKLVPSPVFSPPHVSIKTKFGTNDCLNKMVQFVKITARVIRHYTC